MSVPRGDFAMSAVFAKEWQLQGDLNRKTSVFGLFLLLRPPG